jgi:hypothetical protein
MAVASRHAASVSPCLAGPDKIEIMSPVDPLECPYPGLATFGPQDADRFFGREQLTAVVVSRLAQQLTRPGLLIVAGASGSGKSSLLRAGVVPAIAAGALPVRGSQAWPLVLMIPGRRPMLELATLVAALADVPAGALGADLGADPARITSCDPPGPARLRRTSVTVRRDRPCRRPGRPRLPG